MGYIGQTAKHTHRIEQVNDTQQEGNDTQQEGLFTYMYTHIPTRTHQMHDHQAMSANARVHSTHPRHTHTRHDRTHHMTHSKPRLVGLNPLWPPTINI